MRSNRSIKPAGVAIASALSPNEILFAAHHLGAALEKGIAERREREALKRVHAKLGQAWKALALKKRSAGTRR
jgi:hypothetical protein